VADDVTKLAAIPEMSVDARTLMERLQRCQVDETVSYEELSILIGRDVQRDVRYLLATARLRLLEDDDNPMYFGAVTNVGLKRLAAIDLVGTGEQSLQHIRRTSRRAARVQAIVPLQELDAVTKRNALFYQSMFGVLTCMTQHKVVKALETKVEATALPVGTMLAEMVRTL